MSNIIKGKKLMVFMKTATGDFQSIAYATSHSLNVSVSTVSVTTKDNVDTTGIGSWQAEEPDVFSWTMNTENLIGVSGSGKEFDDLMTAFLAGTKVTLRFAVAAQSTTGPAAEGWDEASSGAIKGLQGEAYITSLDLNASNGDNASFSATFTGVGALTQDA